MQVIYGSALYTGRHRYLSKKPDNGQYDLRRYSMLGTGTALLVKIP
jgi:hypothetical protein